MRLLPYVGGVLIKPKLRRYITCMWVCEWQGIQGFGPSITAAYDSWASRMARQAFEVR